MDRSTLRETDTKASSRKADSSTQTLRTRGYAIDRRIRSNHRYRADHSVRRSCYPDTAPETDIRGLHRAHRLPVLTPSECSSPGKGQGTIQVQPSIPKVLLVSS